MTSPNTKVAPAEAQDEQGQEDALEITPEEFPDWHALATEAMDEVAKGSVERWP